MLSACWSLRGDQGEDVQWLERQIVALCGPIVLIRSVSDLA